MLKPTLMNKKSLIALAFIFLFSLPCAAGDKYVGIFNSLKGFGVVIESPASGTSFNEFGIYADIYGFPTGRATFYPGAKIYYLRNRVVKNFQAGEATCRLYLGAGGAAGYVHDFETPKKVSEISYLRNSMGICAAAAGDAGLRAEFSGRLALDLSFELEAGMFVGKDENGSTKLGLYKNGLYHTIYPQLSILWKF